MKFRVVCSFVLFIIFLNSFSHAKEGKVNSRDDSCTGYVLLNRYERGQFLEVSMGQRAEVLAQYLSARGCGQQMLEGLRSLSATIRYSDQRSGYALVAISKDKLLETLDLPGITYASTRDDDRMYYQDPAAKIPQSKRKADPLPAIAIPYPHVATTLAPDGPYFATDEIGLTDLRKRHPEADGRGVRVAVPDEGFDLLHPALQQARDAAGHIVPKVADLGTLTSPEEDSGWVRFGDAVNIIQGRFAAGGRTWTVPEDGTYRFGIFKQNLRLGLWANSHAKMLSVSVGVLWDQKRGRIWVDTDGDGSFRNQRALGDYGVTHDVDWFGTKEGGNDNRIPFGVKIDVAQNAVYLRIGGDHGALVAGPLSANTSTGGLFNGAAPSAQIIDDKIAYATSLASIVRMFSRSDVDVINRSGGVGRAGRDGAEDFAQHVVERVIAVYDKPMSCFCASVGTIHVNDYAGPKMLRRNRQLGPPYRDTIHGFAWDLPSGLINSVLAPSTNLVTESRYMPGDLPWADGRLHLSADLLDPPAPEGYTIGDNNSPTIPVVSGVLADLISEAKREKLRYNAVRLNNAIFTGTQLLDGFPLSQQGYGLINAGHSWDQLARMAKADDPNNPLMTSFDISRMEDDHSIEVQGFHADLSEPGQKLNGEIWITRHGGYPGGRKYTFSLRGNDGSYELLDREAELVRDQATRVRFRTNGASGWNIVFLELRDAKADVVMKDVPLSVRVPDVPGKIAPGVDKYESTIQPLRTELRYVRIGDDVQAARYVMQIPYTGPENISLRYFPGSVYRTMKTPPGEAVDEAHHVGPMETLESLVVNDEPGAQEIYWENRGRPEYATQYDDPAPDVPIHAELTVSKYAVDIRSSGDAMNITNELAAIKGRVELYDATLKTESLIGSGSHGMGEAETTLPASLAEWRLRVTPSGPSDDIADVYVLNCAGKNGCIVAALQEISVPSKTLTIEAPQAGAWKIVIRNRDQVQSSVPYMVHEALLTLAKTPIEAADGQHGSGASWAVPLPKEQSDAQYAAFRIAGTQGVTSEKNGLVIAMTPLHRNAP